ncbi:MAG: diguanylate cyclase [Gallionella sp.]|nr:diguanylate cyclase [Gallionella sp.]
MHALLLDSLEDQIAVIDSSGTIVYVNRAWSAFGTENGLASGAFGAGTNYLDVCNFSSNRGDRLANVAMDGLKEVLEGRRATYYFEYPCHSPTEKRWFMMRVTALQDPAKNLFVISHHNITQRKLAEETAEHLSLHDPLTGLANRRYLDQLLGNEWRRNSRSRMPVSFIMFDLDHFKDYNDDLGHPAGDQCLVKVARFLNTFSRRPGDLALRYGGEEFGLFLVNTGLEQAHAIAESVRMGIHDLSILYSGTKRMTVSAGVASVVPDNDHEYGLLIKEADSALYRSKQAGRNQTISATPAAE